MATRALAAYLSPFIRRDATWGKVRMPCGSRFRAIMRTAPYCSDPGESERLQMRQEHRLSECVILEAARVFYWRLQSVADCYAIDPDTFWWAHPSTGLRAWRWAVIVNHRCRALVREAHHTPLLLTRLRQHGVPFVELPSYLLIARSWFDSPEVASALAEVKGIRTTERRRKRAAKLSRRARRA